MYKSYANGNKYNWKYNTTWGWDEILISSYNLLQIRSMAGKISKGIAPEMCIPIHIKTRRHLFAMRTTLRPRNSLLITDNISLLNNPSLEPWRCSASQVQKFAVFLWNKISCYVHKSLGAETTSTLMNPLHVLKPYFSNISCNIILPSMSRSSE
jgi:hypothetical protein